MSPDEQSGAAGTATPEHGGPTTLKVTVSFPLSAGGPYQADLPPATTVGYVLREAMLHFQVSDEPNVTYYLTAHGERWDPATTIGQVAGHAAAVAFRLIKEITQG